MTSAGEPLWIGVDVGGTKVLAGVVNESGHVARTARRATPGRRVDIAQVEDALEAADRTPIAGVGVAAAGFVDAAGERVMSRPTCPARGEDVRERLSQRWGVPVVLDNDAKRGQLAEWICGAARWPGLLGAVLLGQRAGAFRPSADG